MLSKAMMGAYWVQFARSGNPNRDGLPAWPSFNLTEQPHLRLDVEMAQGQKMIGENGSMLWTHITQIS